MVRRSLMGIGLAVAALVAFQVTGCSGSNDGGTAGSTGHGGTTGAAGTFGAAGTTGTAGTAGDAGTTGNGGSDATEHEPHREAPTLSELHAGFPAMSSRTMML